MEEALLIWACFSKSWDSRWLLHLSKFLLRKDAVRRGGKGGGASEVGYTAFEMSRMDLTERMKG